MKVYLHRNVKICSINVIFISKAATKYDSVLKFLSISVYATQNTKNNIINLINSIAR